MVGIAVDVEGFIIGLSVWIVGSVQGFRVTSRRLQIFRFVFIEMFSPCFLYSRVMSFLVRSDCGPFAFLRSTSPSSL